MRVSSLPLRSLLAITLAGVAGSFLVATTGPASAATCADVDIVFARGTGEVPGFGITGGPFVNSLTSALSGRSITSTSYAVNYSAPADQSGAGPGGTDMSTHVASVAAACPGTRFVLGGFSQGASVTDVAIGITGGGTAIPASLSSRVAAVVVFGNPLGLSGRTIATASPVYGARSKDYCNSGDPVCGGGSNVAAHLQYASNGMTAAGAQFAAGLVASRTPIAPPIAPPTTQPTAPPVTVPPSIPIPTAPATTAPATTAPATTVPSTTPPVATPPVVTPPPATPQPAPSACVTATTKQHLAAKRAINFFWLTFAKGSNTFIGPVSSSHSVSLAQAGTTWKQVAHC